MKIIEEIWWKGTGKKGSQAYLKMCCSMCPNWLASSKLHIQKFFFSLKFSFWSEVFFLSANLFLKQNSKTSVSGMTNSGMSTLINNKTMWDGNMHNRKMGTFTGKTDRTRCWWFPQESAEPGCYECNSDWKETGPVKVTDILLWMSGSDLSPSAILLESQMVNSNYVLFSWPVSQCSVHIRVLQIL